MTDPPAPAVPAAPRDAATVALLRDTATGPEVFLLRRVATMAFAGGMTVFPGGSVDPADSRDIDWAGASPTTFAARFGIDVPRARSLVVAAVRETFEESGVLLAGRTPGAVIAADRDTARAALETHSLTLAEMLAAESLALQADLLVPWSRWVTPTTEPRRYDTFFFAAACPPGQTADLTTGEAEIAEWARPVDALAQADAGRRALLPPTRVTLEQLAGAPSVAALLVTGANRRIDPVAPILIGDTAMLPDGRAIELPRP